MYLFNSNKRRFVFIGLLGVFLLANLAWAEHPNENPTVENLRQRIELLEAENQHKPQSEPTAELPWADRIRIDGLLEFELGLSKEGSQETSDLTLATAQLGVESKVNDNIAGHMILLWEEGPDEQLSLDEAVISMTCPKKYLGQTASLNLGRMYVPFGKFNSAMLTDPLTLELGETNDTAGLFSLQNDIWSFQAGVFNGEVDKSNGQDRIDSWVVALDFFPTEGVSLGVSYLSDLAESDIGLVPSGALSQFSDSVAASSAYISLQRGPISFDAEILGALDSFTPLVYTSPGTDLSGAKPRAWSLELGWLLNEKWSLALHTDGAKDFIQDIHRYGVASSYGLFKNTTLAVEYLLSNDDQPGSDENHNLTIQLALTF